MLETTADCLRHPHIEYMQHAIGQQLFSAIHEEQLYHSTQSLEVMLDCITHIRLTAENTISTSMMCMTMLNTPTRS